MKRFAPVLGVLALAAAATGLLVAAPDLELALTGITWAMLAGAVILLGAAILADVRRVASSWGPTLGGVLIAILVVASTTALSADLALGAIAALVAALAVAVITWRTWHVSRTA